MSEDLTQESPTKRRLIFLAKLLLTTGMIWVVIQQADIDKIVKYIKQTDPIYLLLSLIALNVGQIFSGLRMRYYLKSGGLELSRGFAISLYYVGMLFNLVLPGGVGGDGYKAYYLRKNKGFPWKTSLKFIILGRGSGLLLLVLLTLGLATLSSYVMSLPYAKLLVILGLLAAPVCYAILTNLVFKESLKTLIGAAKYSAVVQGLVVVTAVFFLKGVGYEGDVIDYVILFMISSIVSIIPISIGGLGLRELTFFYGAGFMMLDPELGVTISVLCYVVNALASLMGVIFFYRLKGE